jgi:tRNA(Arg) A34 adenosine deaminase TadA
MKPAHPPLRLRRMSLALVGAFAVSPVLRAQTSAPVPDRRWYEVALAMRNQAQADGEAPYGAAVVKAGKLVSQAPSRVNRLKNPDAHAEREAIREAVAALGAAEVRGALLYSTSRPCWACERAAASAGIARMYFGHAMEDAGVPQAK